uniref:Major facilitator superfamily (MFS) profile domain-containing protein n=1 Tax=Chromera velia CCMP2878 TaxID=1169474 RepID=A0A0G4HP79_9ALVE|eukprot:Cvel_7759.t1-p1 / transcript=Cvel_7759.t1 / gene=Cvel_7759 / organism=Chromera_velia_CCMP2878 / gene_product=Putative transporter ZK637.1, putative / transcript_product=Putative transporter ZK637.1, putative / location=Cvel_scaffold413:51725-54577(+) / protein_length=648 / sequence_SO=supercontig / SO=protein_coding / is_pseudo=false
MASAEQPQPTPTDPARGVSGGTSGSAGSPGNRRMTVSETIDHIGHGRFQTELKWLCSLLTAADGVMIMVLSFLGAFLRCEWGLNNAQVALLTMALFAGQGVASPFWGWVSDNYGRKFGLVVGGSVLLASGCCASVAPEFWSLFSCIFGIGIGIGTVPVVTMFFAEFLPSEQRGAQLAALNYSWAIGVVVVAFLAMFIGPCLGWRWLMFIASLPTAVPLALSPLLPESPLYHASVGKTAQAKDTLHQVARVNDRALPRGHSIFHGESGEESGGEGEAGRDPQREETRRTAPRSLAQVWRDPNLRLAVFHLLPMWFCIAFLYYGIVLMTTEMPQSRTQGARCSPVRASVRILQTEAVSETRSAADALSMGGTRFEAAGGLEALGRWWIPPAALPSLSSSHGAMHLSSRYGEGEGEGAPVSPCPFELKRDDYMTTIVSALGEFPGILLSAALLDRVGRRWTLFGLYVLFSLPVFFLLFCFSLDIEKAVFASVFVTARMAAVGAFASLYVYTSELFPTSVGARTVGMLAAVSRLGCMATPFVAQMLLYRDSAAAVLLYVAAAALSAALSLSLRKETLGRRMGESYSGAGRKGGEEKDGEDAGEEDPLRSPRRSMQLDPPDPLFGFRRPNGQQRGPASVPTGTEGRVSVDRSH